MNNFICSNSSTIFQYNVAYDLALSSKVLPFLVSMLQGKKNILMDLPSQKDSYVE